MTAAAQAAYAEFERIHAELNERCAEWEDLTHADRMGWEAAVVHVKASVSVAEAQANEVAAKQCRTQQGKHGRAGGLASHAKRAELDPVDGLSDDSEGTGNQE